MSPTRARTRTHPLLLCGIAALCVGAGLPRAFADQPAAEPGTSIKVKYGDLNLASPSGVEVLYKRIQKAARRVCTIDSAPADPVHVSHWQDCYRTAFANAIRDVDNQPLTAMYRQKNNLPPVG